MSREKDVDALDELVEHRERGDERERHGDQGNEREQRGVREATREREPAVLEEPPEDGGNEETKSVEA